jgi:hypothetical protein
MLFYYRYVSSSYKKRRATLLETPQRLEPDLHYWNLQKNERVQESLVGIATRYSLECSGFETQYAQKIFPFSLPDPSRPALGPPRIQYNG